MLLAIDVGNTNVVLGIFESDRLIRSWRISTRKDRTADEYGVMCRDIFRLSDLSTDDILAVIVCSVVPPLNGSFEEMCQKYFGREPRFVDPSAQDLMTILYEPISDVGGDRIVNGAAARQLYGSPCIIVDFGTATTFDAVSAKGEYLGGTISPGVGISAEALFARASRLPRVQITRPAHVVGRSTVESIQSGLYYGYLGLVDGILVRMKRELNCDTVVATGGLASLLSAESTEIGHVDNDLTVKGLKIFYDHLSADA